MKEHPNYQIQIRLDDLPFTTFVTKSVKGVRHITMSKLGKGNIVICKAVDRTTKEVYYNIYKDNKIVGHAYLIV